MSERDVTFRMKLVSDPANQRAAQETASGVKDVGKQLDEVKEKSRKSTLAMADGFRLAGEGAIKLARGVGFLAATTDKDLKKFLETLVKIQAAVDIGRGTLDMIKGISQAYQQWATAAKATAAANEILAASNMKVAATGQAAAGGGGVGGGGLGRGLAMAGGVGLGGYAGYKFAESQGMGFGGQMGMTVAGGVGGGLLTAGALKYGPGALSRVGGMLGGIGRGLGRFGGPLAGAVMAGAAFGEHGSRIINRGDTGENAGTLEIGKEALGRWWSERGRGRGLDERLAFRGSQEFQNASLGLNRQRTGSEIDFANSRMNQALMRNSAFAIDPTRGLQGARDIFKSNLISTQDRIRGLERNAGGGGNELERKKIADDIKQLKAQELSISQQIAQTNQSLLGIARANKEETKEKVRLEKEAQATTAKSFALKSRGEQMQIASAVKRYDSGDRSQRVLETLNREGIYKDRVSKDLEAKGRSDIAGLGISEGVFGESNSMIAKLNKQVESQGKSLEVAGESFLASQQKTFEVMISVLRKGTEEDQKAASQLAEILQLQNQSRG